MIATAKTDGAGMRYFLDTNIILYAYSTDASEAAKRDIARRILTQPDWSISAQVLQEFYSNATKPKRGTAPLMSHTDAQTTVQGLAQFTSVALDAVLVQQAIALRQQHQLSYWDAAIVAAAVRSGAKELMTEDLNAGQVIEGITVVNPFA
jgi:predicted nucleic acid-binding protein